VQAREKALYRLALIGVVFDYTVEYGAGTLTVELDDYDTAHVDQAVLAFTERTEPGRTRTHRAAVAAAPADFDARVKHHLTLVVETLYRVIEPARVYALREMYRLATGNGDDTSVRATIAAYLSDGPLAKVLRDAVDAEFPDLKVLQEALASLPASDPYEWAAVAARQLESFGRHPALLVTRTLGEAWLPDGTYDEFAASVTTTLRSLIEYDLELDDVVGLVTWMRQQLYQQYDGRRAGWSAALWSAWSAVPLPHSALDELEQQVLSERPPKSVHPAEASALAERATRRVAARAAALAASVIGASEDP
jgi:ATP-dependent DNA helicase RecQ